MDTFEKSFTESISRAGVSEIPKISREKVTQPWTNDEFLSLLEKRSSCNDPSDLRELGKAIKKLRLE